MMFLQTESNLRFLKQEGEIRKVEKVFRIVKRKSNISMSLRIWLVEEFVFQAVRSVLVLALPNRFHVNYRTC